MKSQFHVHVAPRPDVKRLLSHQSRLHTLDIPRHNLEPNHREFGEYALHPPRGLTELNHYPSGAVHKAFRGVEILQQHHLPNIESGIKY